jgi:hypothetical protein
MEFSKLAGREAHFDTVVVGFLVAGKHRRLHQSGFGRSPNGTRHRGSYVFWNSVLDDPAQAAGGRTVSLTADRNLKA